MCIKSIIAFFRGKKNAQEQEQAPRNRVRGIGQYKPKADYVRISNIACSAGVSTSYVREVAKELGVHIYKFTGNTNSYVIKADAVDLHTYISKHNATTRG